MEEKNRFLKSWAGILAVPCLVGALACGCSPPQRIVDIDSKPTGASIYVNGELKGTTRNEKVVIQFRDKRQRVLIQIVKSRYKPILQYWMLDEVPEKRVFPLEVD